jgi:hypothetical protein
MAIGNARRQAVDSRMICSRTRCELTLVVFLSVLTISFSFDAGPVLRCTWARTAFWAAWSAAIADASIVQGAMLSIRDSSRFTASGPQLYGSSVKFYTHRAAAIPNINELFW